MQLLKTFLSLYTNHCSCNNLYGCIRFEKRLNSPDLLTVLFKKNPIVYLLYLTINITIINHDFVLRPKIIYRSIRNEHS